MQRLDEIHLENTSFLLATESEVARDTENRSAVGVDVGLKDFAILSDGTVYSNPKFFRTLEEKLAKAQRIMSRQTVGGRIGQSQNKSSTYP